jgi:hypothetical protein
MVKHMTCLANEVLQSFEINAATGQYPALLLFTRSKKPMLK